MADAIREKVARPEVPFGTPIRSVGRASAEVRAHFASARFLPGNRIVFNLKGNDYRLVVAVRYEIETVYIRFVGTHAENDKTDAATV